VLVSALGLRKKNVQSNLVYQHDFPTPTEECPFKANSSTSAWCLMEGGQINKVVEKSSLKSNLAQLDLFTF
jgi:hypothetical protein